MTVMTQKSLVTDTKKKVPEITIDDLFDLADSVAKKNDKSSKKIMNSAVQKWEEDSRYAY